MPGRSRLERSQMGSPAPPKVSGPACVSWPVTCSPGAGTTMAASTCLWTARPPWYVRILYRNMWTVLGARAHVRKTCSAFNNPAWVVNMTAASKAACDMQHYQYRPALLCQQGLRCMPAHACAYCCSPGRLPDSDGLLSTWLTTRI